VSHARAFLAIQVCPLERNLVLEYHLKGHTTKYMCELFRQYESIDSAKGICYLSLWNGLIYYSHRRYPEYQHQESVPNMEATHGYNANPMADHRRLFRELQL